MTKREEWDRIIDQVNKKTRRRYAIDSYKPGSSRIYSLVEIITQSGGENKIFGYYPASKFDLALRAFATGVFK